MYSFPCSQAGYPQGHGNYVVLFSVVNYRRLYDRMPPMWTKKCIVEGWWLTASVEWRPPFPTRNEHSDIFGGIVVFSVPPLPLRRLVRSAFALYCCALRAVVLRLWFDDFQRVHEHPPFDAKNFKYVFDCFDCLCGEKITLLCLRFLHWKALACNASELRFRLAYFNFLDYFFGSRALRFSHWYFSFSNCGFSSFFYFRFFSSFFLSFIENQLLRSATARGKFLYLVALVSTTVAKFLLRVVSDILRLLQLTLFRSVVCSDCPSRLSLFLVL
jgi:hypothetical protein